MKYRRLSLEELQEMEKEFIIYLSSQSISSDMWEEIKEKHPERAEAFIEQFSDIIMERVLAKVEYLEQKLPTELHLYKCLEDKLLLIGLLVKGATAFDFTQNADPATMMQQIQISGASVQFFQAERAYKKDRNQDIFELIQKGALISKDGTLYQTLEELKK